MRVCNLEKCRSFVLEACCSQFLVLLTVTYRREQTFGIAEQTSGIVFLQIQRTLVSET